MREFTGRKYRTEFAKVHEFHKWIFRSITFSAIICVWHQLKLCQILKSPKPIIFNRMLVLNVFTWRDKTFSGKIIFTITCIVLLLYTFTLNLTKIKFLPCLILNRIVIELHFCHLLSSWCIYLPTSYWISNSTSWPSYLCRVFKNQLHSSALT